MPFFFASNRIEKPRSRPANREVVPMASEAPLELDKVAPFLIKLFEIVSSPTSDNLVCWSVRGRPGPLPCAHWLDAQPDLLCAGSACARVLNVVTVVCRSMAIASASSTAPSSHRRAPHTPLEKGSSTARDVCQGQLPLPLPLLSREPLEPSPSGSNLSSARVLFAGRAPALLQAR